MKKLVLAVALSSAVSFSASAKMEAETQVKYVGDLHYASLCKAVVGNDVSMFKRALHRFVGTVGASRKSVLNRVLDNDNVTCSGQGLIEFSQERNASEITAYINKATA